MRAIRLHNPAALDRLVVDTAVLGTTGPGDIRVRLRASSLNYHDYLIATGIMPVADRRIPMSDGAGEIVEIGQGVSEFVPGDRVVSTFFPRWLAGPPCREAVAELPGDRTDGYARDEVVAPANAFTKAPAGYSHIEAATLPCAALTAWRALFVEATVLPGDVVLIQGTGGVAIFALQFAKAAGATVIATSSSDAKLERLSAMGADHVINYRSNQKWGDAVKCLTAGRGVDHVVEVSGSLTQSLSACRMGGHIALIAAPTDRLSFKAITSNIRVTGLTVGSRAHQQAMVRAIEANGIRPIIDSVYPLEGIAEAFRHQETQRHFGKICLEW